MSDETDSLSDRADESSDLYIIPAMQALYNRAKAARVGDRVTCPGCGGPFTKKTYQHTFCLNGCKDQYWNRIDPSRMQRPY